MGRKPCCSKEGLNRGAWSAKEDKILTDYIKIHGEGKWRDVPQRAGLKRCGKSCRLRWLNYLRPDIKRGNISKDEDELIIRLHRLLGNRWSLIAGRLPGRTDNEVKNYWNTNLSKRISSAGNKTEHSNSGDEKLFRNNPTEAASAAVPVIRTRAVRCTKVVIPQLKPDSQGNTNLSTPKPDSISGNNCCPAIKENNLQVDFLMDLDIDELLSSEAFGVEGKTDVQIMEEDQFKETAAAAGSGETAGVCKSDLVGREPKLNFSMEEEKCTRIWTADDFFQMNEALDLFNIGSYLESEDGWTRVEAETTPMSCSH